MSLSISIYDEASDSLVYETDVAHHLARVFDQIGLYYALWYPRDINVETVKQLLPFLKEGKNKIMDISVQSLQECKVINEINILIEELIAIGKTYPDASLRVSR